MKYKATKTIQNLHCSNCDGVTNVHLVSGSTGSATSLQCGEAALDMNPDTASPESIASAILNGNRDAESLLYQKYHKVLLFVLSRKCSDKDWANDLCQETFRIAIEKLRRERIDEPRKLSSYLHGIAINLYRTGLRQDTRWKPSNKPETIESIPAEPSNQAEELHQYWAAEVVRKTILKVRNTRYSDILYRYYVCDWDKKKICNDLNVDHRHFDRLLFLAKLRFKEILLECEEGMAIKESIDV